MAIYHLSVKPISRSSGRSATASAAYRSGKKITDERTGEIHDYTRKKGVESADIILPKNAPDWAKDRSQLWNAAELAESRKNACVAREFEVALPRELPAEERRKLAIEFAQEMADSEGCAVDVAIHAPSSKHDNENYHAHILRTTRKIEADGLGEKLDTEKAGRKRKDDLEAIRTRWADMTNAALERNGIAARVDHRTLKQQGIDRDPTKHLGPAATGYERRTGLASDNRIRQEADKPLARPHEIEHELDLVEQSISKLSGELDAEKAKIKKMKEDGIREFHRERLRAKEAAEVKTEEDKQIEREFEQAAERFEKLAEKQLKSAEDFDTAMKNKTHPQETKPEIKQYPPIIKRGWGDYGM